MLWNLRIINVLSLLFIIIVLTKVAHSLRFLLIKGFVAFLRMLKISDKFKQLVGLIGHIHL